MDDESVRELATSLNRVIAQATEQLEGENALMRNALKDIALGPRQEPDFIAYVVNKAKRTLGIVAQKNVE